MEELEIILEVENDNELEINILEEEIKEVFPKLEDLEVTPSGVEQNFKSDKYGYDNVKVQPVSSNVDEDIKPENIRKGVEILGVEGSFYGIDTSDATATSDDILKDKTAYVNNEKVTGTIEEYDGTYTGNTVEQAKITDATELFYKGRRTDYIEELILLCDKVSSTSNMFSYCQKLTELDVSKLDTSNVTDMYAMFQQCVVLKSLDVSNFDTSNVTYMHFMFNDCYLIETLDLSNFDTSNVTQMQSMFSGCKKLTSLDVSNFDTSKVTAMNSMFYDCQALTELDISNFDMSNVNSTNYIFNGSRNLVNLKFGTNLGKGYGDWSSVLQLSYCTKLTHDSLMSVINNLYDLNLTYDVANGGTLYTQKLILGTTNLAKLTAEEIAIATNKGWTVS